MSPGKFIALIIVLFAVFIILFVPIYYQMKDEQKIKNFNIFKNQKPVTIEDLNGK